jgi:hypothetical protein
MEEEINVFEKEFNEDKGKETNWMFLVIIALAVVVVTASIFLFWGMMALNDGRNSVTNDVVLRDYDYVEEIDETLEEEVIDEEVIEEVVEENVVEWKRNTDEYVNFAFTYPDVLTLETEKGDSDLMMTYYVKSDGATLKIFAYRAEGGPGVGGLTHLKSYDEYIKLDGWILGSENSYRIVSEDFTGYGSYFNDCESSYEFDCRDYMYSLNGIFTDEIAMGTSTMPMYLTIVVSGEPTEVDWEYFDAVVVSLDSL